MIVFDCLFKLKWKQEHIILLLIVKITLFGLSTLYVGKTQNFNSILQLIHDISSDYQKLLSDFNGTAIFAFSRTLVAAVLPNNLVFYLKDLKSLVSATVLLKLVASSLK